MMKRQKPITKSPECIAPSAFDTIERQQSAKVGVFNLISTMIGGGVLSLPFAVSRCGLILGFSMLTLSAIASVFSFDILISSSRRTGAMTYQQIGFFAFGPRTQPIITAMIWCLTYLASIGYCVLVGDLFKPIICYLGGMSDTECSSEWLRRIVIFAGILCVSPFCYKRQTKALRFTSIVSIISVTSLAVIIALKTASKFGKEHEIYYINDKGIKMEYMMKTDIHLWPQSVDDIIYVFPVFFLSFMCHFNIPQVHSELTRPTRRRMRIVLITVVCACYILYSTVAFFGYFYSFSATCGNILLNYNQNDPMITLARLCLGFVILFTYPLLILPARKAMHNLLNLIYKFKSMNLEDIDDIDFEESICSDTQSEISLSKHSPHHNDDNDDNDDTETEVDTEDDRMQHIAHIARCENNDKYKGHIFDFNMNDNDGINGTINHSLNQSLIGAAVNSESVGYSLFDGHKNNKNNKKNKNKKVKDKNNKLIQEREDIIINNINKEMKKLQVLNKKPASSKTALISPNDESLSIHSSSSYNKQQQQQQRVIPLTYNTFNCNTSSISNNNKLRNAKPPKIYTKFIKNDKTKYSKSTGNLLRMLNFGKTKKKKNNDNVEHSASKSSKGSPRSAVSQSRGRAFTTRSFSRIDSPLRGPQDALGIINEPKDVDALRDADFTKSFKNLEGASNFTPTNLWLIGETTLLIGLSLIVSFLTESVMVLWGIVGSTVTFVIAFTLPGMFYFKIRFHRKGWTLRNIASIIIVIISSLAIILCTWQALLRLDAEPCPNQPPSSMSISNT